MALIGTGVASPGRGEEITKPEWQGRADVRECDLSLAEVLARWEAAGLQAQMNESQRKIETLSGQLVQAKSLAGALRTVAWRLLPTPIWRLYRALIGG